MSNDACDLQAACDFEEDFCAYRNTKEGDDYDWMRGKANKNDRIGPIVDHTLGTSLGAFAHFNQNPMLPYKKGFFYIIQFLFHFCTLFSNFLIGKTTKKETKRG